MALSLSHAAIPAFERMLTNLQAILRKGEAFAAARKIDPGVLVQARLAPDMYPLARQVQIATDLAKYGAARLSGVEAPSTPDTETDFAGLHARLDRTLDLVRKADRAKIDASTDRAIAFKAGGETRTLNGADYLFGFVLPNLYFHVTMAYAILRHNGVELGKADYLGV